MKKSLFFLLLVVSADVIAQSQLPGKSVPFELLQRELFAPSCGIPACHDGSFEPDFRTAESSYNTLVYHPVVKNNSSNQFTYRVVPEKPEESVLYERITNCCFVNQNDRMPFTVGDTLDRSKIEMVKNWILEGAFNQSGAAYPPPPTPISFHEKYYVRGNDTLNMSEDLFHLGGIYPKPLYPEPNISNLTFYFLIRNEEKSETSQYKMGLFSDKNYTKLIREFDLTKEGSGFSVVVPKETYKPGEIVFMQVKVIRKDQTYLYPNSNTPFYQRLHWSVLYKQ
jgi:hypothetical protein